MNRTIAALAALILAATLAGCATDRASTGKERREFITHTVPAVTSEVSP